MSRAKYPRLRHVSVTDLLGPPLDADTAASVECDRIRERRLGKCVTSERSIGWVREDAYGDFGGDNNACSSDYLRRQKRGG
jgi:hypothetical protein